MYYTANLVCKLGGVGGQGDKHIGDKSSFSELLWLYISFSGTKEKL
jgi:hypothetical protein